MFRTVLLQRAFLRLMPRQRFMNAYVTNVPGPPIPLYFAGAPLLEIFPIVPLTATALVAAATLGVANLLAILPARRAARMRPAVALRTE